MKYSKYAYVVIPTISTIYDVDFSDNTVYEIYQCDGVMESGTIHSMSPDCEDFMDFIDVSEFLDLIAEAAMVVVSDSLLVDILSSFWNFDEVAEALAGTSLAERISLAELAAML